MHCATQHGNNNTVHHLIQKANLISTLDKIGHVVQRRKGKVGTTSERLLVAKEGNRRGQLFSCQSDHFPIEDPIQKDIVVREKSRQSFGSDLRIPNATHPPLRKAQLKVSFSDHLEMLEKKIWKRRRRPRRSSSSTSGNAAEGRVMPDVNSIPDIQVWDIDDSETFAQVMAQFTLK